MAKEINQRQAAYLWDSIGVTVENIRLAPRGHRGGVVFCGYADIILWAFAGGETIPLVHLCGNSIKLMGDRLHFDPKSERGKGDRASHFFPHWIPAGPESRAVLTRKLSELPEIQEMVRNARAQTQSTTTGG